jgi:hypothetical protein
MTLGSHKFSQLLTAFFLGGTPQHQCVGGGVGLLENKVPGRVQQVLTLCPFDPVGASISIWFVGTRLCALGWEDRDLLTSSAFKLLGGVLWSFQGSVSSPEAVLSLFQVLC